MTELAASPAVGTTGAYPPAHLGIIFRRVELVKHSSAWRLLALGLLVACIVACCNRNRSVLPALSF